jgi:hypothetical protein
MGPGNVRPGDDMVDREIYACSLRDINDDGIPELILYFSGDSDGIN